MLSKSDGHLSTGLLERPPSGVNPAASIMAQPVQLVQAVPVLPSFYQSGVPVVMRQIPRMPMTVLPQPMTVSHQPSATGIVQQPVLRNSYHSTAVPQDLSTAANTTDNMMQIFVERAEKSGIKLEALPESNILSKVEKQSAVGRSYSVHAVKTSHLTGHSWDCSCLHCRTQASPASVNNHHPALNISCPEFVPRLQQVASHQYADALSGRHVSGSGNVHPVTVLNSRTDCAVRRQCVAADELVCSAGVDDASSEYTYLPERFANVAIGQGQKSAVGSFAAERHRDASTQTAKVDMANACVGNFSPLLVDASTNTTHYDETVGVQQTLVRSESNAVNMTAQNDCRDIRSAGSLSDTVGIGLQSRSSVSTSLSDRWADCWQTAAESVDTQCKSNNASKNLTPASSASAVNDTASSADRRESSGLHVDSFSAVCNIGTKSSSLGGAHQMHGVCDCSFSNCPFASSTPSSSMQRDVVHEQSTGASGHERVRGVQKPSPTLSSPLSGEDLNDQIYYSDDEDEDDILPDDTADQNQPAEAKQDCAALLSQLTNGSLPSQTTIDLAIVQLMEALTAEEKQLVAQLVQQMAVMSPVLVATNPLALQVEAIRTILTTRSQRARALGMPPVPQVACQSQLSQNRVSPVATAAVQPTNTMAPTQPCPVSVRHSDQSEHTRSLSQVSRTRQQPVTDETATRFPVPKSKDSTALDTDVMYPDECSSASSGHGQLGAGPVLARGRGRGVLSTGRQFDDAACQQDRPRGRGLRRAKSRNSAAAGTSSVPDPVRQPLIPPVSHTARPVHQRDPAGNPAVGNVENWEEEIDEFGSDVFLVKSSFFSSGKR